MKLQLIYMSAATRQLDSFELTDLLLKARQKNQTLGISGMLLYHEGSFLQVLEGEENAVDALYERIARDDRHTNCALLLRTFIDNGSFDDWSMGFMNTRLDFKKSLPGFNDFFSGKFTQQTFATDPTASRKLLLGFRDGKWRQTVEF